MSETSRELRRVVCIALLLLPALLWAVVARTDAPSAADRDRAIRIQKEAVDQLREGAKAGATGDAAAFASQDSHCRSSPFK